MASKRFNIAISSHSNDFLGVPSRKQTRKSTILGAFEVTLKPHRHAPYRIGQSLEMISYKPLQPKQVCSLSGLRTRRVDTRHVPRRALGSVDHQGVANTLLVVVRQFKR